MGSLLRVRFAADFFGCVGFLARSLDFLALGFFFVFALGAELDFFLRLALFLAMQKV